MPPLKNREVSLNHSLVGPASMPPSGTTADPSTDAEDHARALLDLSIALVDAALDILERHIRTDEQLRKASVLMPGGTVGKHFRHVIEVFQAFLIPLLSSSRFESFSSSSAPPYSPSQAADLEINYDAPLPTSRRSIARSLPSCRAAMKEVRQGLVQWEENTRTDPHPGEKIDGKTGSSGGLATEMQRRVRLVAVTPTKQVMESSVGRELWFCSLHAIHHFSMLRTIAVHELGLSLPVEFGTAPSTLLYRAQDWKPPAAPKSDQSPLKSKL